jgi:7 transmembrane receptor (rhodopsin family)
MLNTSVSDDALPSIGMNNTAGADVNASCCTNCSCGTGPSQFERIVGTAVPSLFGLIVIVGLAGNLVVVLVVALHPRARTATSLLMLNLAVADLLFIVVCVPSTAARYALPFWPFGLVWCKVRVAVIES